MFIPTQYLPQTFKFDNCDQNTPTNKRQYEKRKAGSPTDTDQNKKETERQRRNKRRLEKRLVMKMKI